MFEYEPADAYISPCSHVGFLPLRQIEALLSMDPLRKRPRPQRSSQRNTLTEPKREASVRIEDERQAKSTQRIRPLVTVRVRSTDKRHVLLAPLRDVDQCAGIQPVCDEFMRHPGPIVPELEPSRGIGREVRAEQAILQ